MTKYNDLKIILLWPFNIFSQDPPLPMPMLSGVNINFEK